MHGEKVRFRKLEFKIWNNFDVGREKSVARISCKHKLSPPLAIGYPNVYIL